MEVCCLLLWLSLCVSSASKNGHFLYSASYVFFFVPHYIVLCVGIDVSGISSSLSVCVCLLYKLGLLVQPCKQLPIAIDQ